MNEIVIVENNYWKTFIENGDFVIQLDCYWECYQKIYLSI